MTLDDFEQRLRAELRQTANEAPASALRASVLAIPEAVNSCRQRHRLAG